VAIKRKTAARDVNGSENADLGWYREIGRIIDNLGSERLPETLIVELGRFIPFELAAIFIYRGRSRPLLVYENFEPAKAKQGIAAYVESTHVLNPFYQAYLNGLAEGVYLMRDLAPDAFFEGDYGKVSKVSPSIAEEIGYLTDHWPKGMEELNIAVALEGGALAEVTLSRSHRGQGFCDEDVARVSTIFPAIAAVLRQCCGEFGASGSRASPPDSHVDDAFINFGSSVLTEREREVAQLILRGHSSESIGYKLDISLGTVKTHRKNAYAKLQISSQSELLSMFLRSLQT
jgi:DNA-binding CsgD family transcriptional regulator